MCSNHWPYQRYDTFSGAHIFKVHDVKGSLGQKNIRMVKSGSGCSRLATIEGRKEGGVGVKHCFTNLVLTFLFPLRQHLPGALSRARRIGRGRVPSRSGLAVANYEAN